MKKLMIILIAVTMLFLLTACEVSGSRKDIYTTQANANSIQENQPTPDDLEYSLERYNLIRRAYWVNGQREKAISLPCEIERPLGYIVLFTEGGGEIASRREEAIESWRKAKTDAEVKQKAVEDAMLKEAHKAYDLLHGLR